MERIRLKPCDELDGASRRDKLKNLELLKRKDEQLRTKRLFIKKNLRRKELIIFMKEEQELRYAYPSSIKLMTSNGFGIPLILVERIKRDMA